jgi:hypothetical protein
MLQAQHLIRSSSYLRTQTWLTAIPQVAHPGVYIPVHIDFSMLNQFNVFTTANIGGNLTFFVSDLYDNRPTCTLLPLAQLM